MARIRSIKPEFFTSLTIGKLNPLARLTFIGLWTYADDDGRAIDDVRLVRAAIWPLDERLLVDVEVDLDTLCEAGLIRRYEIHGTRYLAITNWTEHQKISHPKKSRLPDPPPRGSSNLPDTLPEPSGNFPEASSEILETSGAPPPRAQARVPCSLLPAPQLKETDLKKVQSSLVTSKSPGGRARAPPQFRASPSSRTD